MINNVYSLPELDFVGGSSEDLVFHVKYIKQAVKEKNWGVVLEKVMKLMETAETKFKDGAERKEWVLAMLKASADGINYDIDYDAIADMIDSLCDMSKVINPATPANKVTAKKEEGK